MELSEIRPSYSPKNEVTIVEHDKQATDTTALGIDGFLADDDDDPVSGSPDDQSTGYWTRKKETKTEEGEKSHPRIILIFTHREHFRDGGLRRRDALSARYTLPPCIWSDVCQQLQGYFGHENTYNSDHIGITRHATWFHFEVKFPFYKDGGKVATYKWFKMGFVVTWTAPDQCTVIGFNVEPEIQVAITDKLRARDISLTFADPYTVQLLIIESVVQCYDRAVWNLRDQIRNFEKERRGETTQSHTDSEMKFNVLHEILRHALHGTETLGVAVSTLDSMCAQQQTFYDETPGYNIPGPTRVEQKRTKEQLAFQLSMLKGVEARSRANEARIRNEITLAYNLVAQRDSQTQMNIAHDTRTDSFAMRTIAIVTMAFLPSTFVAAIFSTTFFDFHSGESDAISSRFWIFWAVAIPLTVVVVAAWLAWLSWIRRRQRRQALDLLV